jgi:hypothetical protein
MRVEILTALEIARAEGAQREKATAIAAARPAYRNKRFILVTPLPQESLRLLRRQWILHKN